MQTADATEPLLELDRFLEENLGKELLRFTTAGSVDDGKSTLIGRLLHDSKAVYEDQLASIRKSRINRAAGPIDFSLLTDGLRAEREQGITIDVAYRYFSTPGRKFIIADTPGHEQYTRNMATGASTADLAVILIDATKGLLPQTHRHAYIAALLGIPNVIGAVNKMDLVDYDQSVFTALQSDFIRLAGHLGIRSVQCIPISALEGDNIVSRSGRTPWYGGPTLLRHLESVPLHMDQELPALRFPVQSVIRPDRTFRGFSGRVASGTIRPGDAVVALPSKQQTRVEAIVSYDGDLDEAIIGQSVVLKLEKEIDISRGDLLVSAESGPHVSSRFAAMLVWLHENPLKLNRTYLLKHAGRLLRGKATRIRFGIDVNALSEHAANSLAMNEIACVEFASSAPLYFDAYTANRTTGSFILIDPLSNATAGAAMIREDLLLDEVAGIPATQTLRGVTPEEREKRHGHNAAVLAVEGSADWAERLERALFNSGFETALVRAEELSAVFLPSVLSSLWNAGLVTVYATERLSSDERALFQNIAGGLFHEIAGSEEGVARMQQVAEALRGIAADSERRKANEWNR